MKVTPNGWNKTVFPSYGRVDTAIWVHANKTFGEKAWRQLTKMLWAILNKSWRQHPRKQQLYGHLPRIKKTIQVRRTRHAGLCRTHKRYTHVNPFTWMSKDQQEPIYNSSFTIHDVAKKTYRKWWTTDTGVGRGPDRSVLIAWHIYIYIYIHAYIRMFACVCLRFMAFNFCTLFNAKSILYKKHFYFKQFNLT